MRKVKQSRRVRRPRTLLDVCDDIAKELNRQGIVITNKVTGRVMKTGNDVFNFSSRGELFHIWEWWETLFPGKKMDQELKQRCGNRGRCRKGG